VIGIECGVSVTGLLSRLAGFLPELFLAAHFPPIKSMHTEDRSQNAPLTMKKNNTIDIIEERQKTRGLKLLDTTEPLDYLSSIRSRNKNYANS
jgi:hypothetical protein